MLKSSSDFLGAMMAKMLYAPLEDEEWASRVRAWHMSVVLRTDYYSVSLVFSEGLTISRGEVESPTLIATTTFHSLLRLLGGQVSLLRAFATGEVKMRGLFRHPVSSLRFYRLMNSILKR